MNGILSAMTLAQTWTAGGWLMWALLAMSVVALALSLYFFLMLRAKILVPNALSRELTKALTEVELSTAKGLCEDMPSPLAEVVLEGVACLETVPHASGQWLMKCAEEAGARIAERINSQVQWLLDLATLAPMVGLLGTVIGMLQAFGAVASDVSSAKPTLLAEGVSQAIVTTIFGLIVAIPTMALYAYFRRRATRMIGQLEERSSSLMMLLVAHHCGEAKDEVR